MLEQGSQGHAALFGMICQFALTVMTGMLIGILILSVFLPLIKLLNDLS
jgi:type II secretory pathway component PulF